MNTDDFVYNAIYKQCLKLGIHEHIAASEATSGLQDFQKNKFNGKPSGLIEHRIKIAKQRQKTINKGKQKRFGFAK